MSSVYAFFFGIAITTVMVVAALLYLHPNLETILTELCGTTERAKFWTAFSNITLFLTPLIFALHCQPQNAAPAVLIYEVSNQVATALIGLVMAIAVVGFVLGRFIAREHRLFAPATRGGGECDSQAE
jgi:hypothetical protein